MNITFSPRCILQLSALLIMAGSGGSAFATPPLQYRLDAKILTFPASSERTSAAFTDLGTDELEELLRATEGKKILSAPSVITLAGQEATIEIQSRPEYFERRDDGAFELMTVPEDEAPGVSLSATMRPAASDQITVDIEVRVSVIEQREPIPGVSLDVGRPIQSTVAKVQSRLVLRPGRWIALGGHVLEDVSSTDKDLLLVLVQVTTVVPPD